MKTKLIIALVGITLLSICSASIISQNAITSIIQNIMSPTNTEKAMQLINMAATRANKNIAVPNTVIAINECGLPATVLARNNPYKIANEMDFARNYPIRFANEMGLVRSVVPNDVTRLANEPRASCDYMYPVQQKSIRQGVRESPAYMTDMIDFREMYKTTPITQSRENACPCRASMPNTYLPAGISSNQYLPVTNPTNSYLPVANPNNSYLPEAYQANSYLPVANPSPYLPASVPNSFLPGMSPLSAMSPSFLPPPTQSKGQFLRKIPIPPPML